MTRFIDFIVRYRKFVGIAVLVSLGLAAYSARTIEVRFQFRDYFDFPGNPRIGVFRQDIEQFGDPGGFVVALVESNDVLQRDVLEYVQKLTAELEPDPLFSRIRSLTNARVVQGKGDVVAAGPVVEDLPSTAEEHAALRESVLKHPLLVRRLVSADGTMTAVLAQMRIPASLASIDQQEEAHEAMARVVARLPVPDGVRVRVTGAPSVEVGTTRALIADQLILMPAVTALLLLSLYLMFRSFHGILLCMTSVTVATLWTAGLFALTGRPIDIVGSVIPTTILVYGVVDPIFLLSRFMTKLEAGLSRSAAISQTMAELMTPCFITSLTTAFGFAAFVTSAIPSLQTYGLTVAVGVLLSWVTTVVVLPLMLSIMPAPKRRFSTLSTSRQVDRGLASLWAGVKTRLGLTIGLSAVLMIAGSVYAREQHVNNQYVDGLPAGEGRDNVRILEDKLSGVLRVIVHFSGSPDSMKEAAVVRAIARVEHSMQSHPLVTSASSLSDLLAEANQAFSGGDPAARTIPESRALIAQYLAIIDPIDRADFVTTDFSASHLAFLLKDEGSEPTRHFAAELQRVVDEVNFARFGVKAELTGNGVIAYQEIDRSVIEIVYGFALAFVSIVVTMLVVFRSLRIALISVVPNLLPVVGCFVVLRMFDIDLKGDNALVLCLSIGGLFNNTIQFMGRAVQRHRETNESPDDVVDHALRAIGPAAIFTAATLSAGFSVLLLSDFPGLQALGALATLTLILGLIADMVLTPAMFRVWYAWKRRPQPATAEPAIEHAAE